MLSKFLAGSVVALSVGQTYAAGYAWSGVNMGGFDFGCSTNGSCLLDNVVPPLHQYGGNDGAGQMKHFVEDDGLNAFRLPVGWQYLVNNKLGGTLDSTAITKYDALMQACLDTGAYCIIDIHNYARWNGDIVGQGGPKDSEFASLWSQLAKKYAKQTKVVMGIVNEPHDIPDLTIWATSVQAAVTAIRKAGATEHTILLPGTGYTSAESFVSSGSGPALAKVTNVDGSTDNLVFDVHKYLDSDNSGTHAACVGNDISAAFAPLAKWLKQEKRQALLSEIGGGSSTASCMTDVCQVADYLNENSDVYLGMLGWAAGSFDPTSYVLSLTPTQTGSKWTDQPLLTKCFAAKFKGGNGSTSSSGSDTGSETTAQATGGTSTAAEEAPASSQTQYLGGILPHLTGTTAAQTFASSTPVDTDTFAASTAADTAIPTSVPTTSAGAGAMDGGLDNIGAGGAAATTSSSAMVQMPSGANSPIPVGAINSYGFHNTSSVAGPTGTGAGGYIPVTTTTPMGYQPTTMQTVIVSSAQAAVQSGVSGGLNNLGSTGGAGEGGEDECEWVEDGEE